ncbi:MAG: sterol desaturase family protein [Pseudomonadota bacterium]
MTMVLTIVVVIALSLMLVAERWQPAFDRLGGTDRIWSNVALGVIAMGLTFAVVTPASLLATTLGPDWREGWPPLLRLASDVLLLDLYIYLWHRANHEIQFLWRFHRVHHFDSFLDVTSALRFHPGEVLLSVFVRGLFIVLLDISFVAIVLFDALVILSAGFHHSNLKLPRAFDGLLRRLIVTPDHHRVHHTDNRPDTDSNYGTIFSFWDRLFGSYREQPQPGRYGVEGEDDRSLTQLLVNPLR